MKNLPPYTYRTIEQEIEALHFEKASLLLSSCPQTDQGVEGFWQALFASRIHRGMYEFEKAFEQAVLASSRAFDTESTGIALNEQAKCLVAKGQPEKARSLLEEFLNKQNHLFLPALNLTLASLLSEQGLVDSALEETEAVQDYLLRHPEVHRPMCVELCSLCGDLYTYKEQESQASSWYVRGLSMTDSCIPKNWRPLRKALLWHNMADLYEQQENWQEASFCYGKAADSFRQMKDPDLFDASSYEMELYLSIGNFFSNQEEFSTALSWLEMARNILENRPPRQRSYYKARYMYLKGLCHLYLMDEKAAKACLQSAYAIQKELVAKGLDKEEHLGRTAFYLASCLGEQGEELAEKILLNKQALVFFHKYYSKEPQFYLSGIAHMENELGRLLLNSTRSPSQNWYKKSIGSYKLYLERYPQDAFEKLSLLCALYNLFCLQMDLHQEDEGAKTASDFLEYARELALQDPETLPTLLDLTGSICTRLEENGYSGPVLNGMHLFQNHHLQCQLQA